MPGSEHAARVQANVVGLVHDVAGANNVQDALDNIVAGAVVNSRFASYSGDPVTIAALSPGNLTFDNLEGGVALLNLAVPAAPTILVGGIYAATAVIQVDDPPIGAYLQAVLHLDSTGNDAIDATTIGPNASAVADELRVTLSCTFFVPTGGTIRVSVVNNEAATPHDVVLREMSLQRIT